MGVDHARDRDPPARELLHDHRVGRQVEAHPTVLLGDGDAEEPELLHLVDDRRRVLVRGVVVLGLREDLLVDELADHLDDRLLLVGLLVERGGDGHSDLGGGGAREGASIPPGRAATRRLSRATRRCRRRARRPRRPPRRRPAPPRRRARAGRRPRPRRPRRCRSPGDGPCRAVAVRAVAVRAVVVRVVVGDVVVVRVGVVVVGVDLVVRLVGAGVVVPVVLALVVAAGGPPVVVVVAAVAPGSGRAVGLVRGLRSRGGRRCRRRRRRERAGAVRVAPGVAPRAAAAALLPLTLPAAGARPEGDREALAAGRQRHAAVSTRTAAPRIGLGCGGALGGTVALAPGLLGAAGPAGVGERHLERRGADLRHARPLVVADDRRVERERRGDDRSAQGESRNNRADCGILRATARDATPSSPIVRPVHRAGRRLPA